MFHYNHLANKGYREGTIILPEIITLYTINHNSMCRKIKGNSIHYCKVQTTLKLLPNFKHIFYCLTFSFSIDFFYYSAHNRWRIIGNT